MNFLQPGRILKHYRIINKIGQGGMGEVYSAEDTQLGRKVALKILPADVASDHQRMHRFVQEAKAASALNHPNILTIHEIGQAEATHFIATEFIDGETLRQRMTNSRMKLNAALDVTIQAADALAAAHEAGIIHRDIKPENIMLRQRDAYVKVLDFGLAKLIEQPPVAVDTEAPTKALFKTEEGVVMGTVTYMSPEQARGLEVDARSDIFSLGVVLYEMVAGSLPFEGSTASEVLAAILSEKEPPPLARFAREVPAELERIATKALRKEREERYQGIKDMLLDLKRLKQKLEVDAEIERTVPPELRGATGEAKPPSGQEGVSTAQASAAQTATVESARTTSSAEYIISEIKRHKRGVAAILATIILLSVAGIAYYFYFARSANRAAIDSIAVLPLVNTSGDPNTEYLSDGISEALINSLTELRQLRVVARTTAFRYKGKEVDPQQIGRELNVRAVLMGRVRQVGDALNIQVDLVDATTGAQLWGKEYERKASDVLAVKQVIVREVTEKLRLRLSGEEQQRLAKHDTTNAEAYQLYLQGEYLWYKWDDKSLEFYQRAIEKDPNFALAYIGIAESYLHLVGKNKMLAKEGIPKARVAITKALELDATLAEAQNALAEIKYQFEYDWSGAEKDFKRAIELNPNVGQIRLAYGWYLMTAGRFDEALPQMRRAQELDPRNRLVNGAIGELFYYMRQYDKSLEHFQNLLVLEPDDQWSLWAIGEIYEQKRMYAEAVKNYLDGLGRSGELKPEEVERFREIFKESGWQGFLREEESKKKPVIQSYVARLYARLGDKERAFAWLEKAIDERDPSVIRLKIDPAFDSLRSDPRYTKLLQRMNLTP